MDAARQRLAAGARDLTKAIVPDGIITQKMVQSNITIENPCD